jgi:hypothetical protein
VNGSIEQRARRGANVGGVKFAADERRKEMRVHGAARAWRKADIVSSMKRFHEN